MNTRTMHRPNIILITCHDLGRWLDCYGRGPLGTANLDRLASQGIRFANHFCTAPSCSPSRASITTGRYPHSTGCVGLVNIGWDLDESERTLAKMLAEAGYETILCGMQHEHHDPKTLGYERICLEGSKAEKAVDSAIAQLRRPHDRPIFMAIGTNEPHRRFHSDRMTAESDVPVPDYLPDCDGVRREMAGFRKLVQQLDAAMGRLLEALDQTGHAENTLVIFTTDHGIDMPRAKGTLYDPGLETSLLMRWPGVIEPGRVDNTLLSSIDLVPTVLDVLDLPIPENVHGRSYAPRLYGDSCKPRDEIFAEKTHHVMFDPMRCVRTSRYKFIDNVTVARRYELPAGCEMDVEAIVPELCQFARPTIELYDLESDPTERHNVAGEERYAKVEQDLRDRLRAWQRHTDDPLLRGVIPLPPRR